MDYLNKKVEVYRNLHTGGMSVRENAKPRHVIDSDCRELIVENAEFVVQEATRLKVVREKQKQVHAFVKGIATNNNELINNKTKRTAEFLEQEKNLILGFLKSGPFFVQF